MDTIRGKHESHSREKPPSEREPCYRAAVPYDDAAPNELEQLRQENRQLQDRIKYLEYLHEYIHYNRANYYQALFQLTKAREWSRAWKELARQYRQIIFYVYENG